MLPRLLLLATLSIVALAAACGGDDDDNGPTRRPTDPPAVEPTPAGTDDESMVRHTIDLLVYYTDQERFDDMCGLYSEALLSALPCESIKESIVGTAGEGADISSRMLIPPVVEVSGDTATASYTSCLDFGAGENCEAVGVSLVRTPDGWRIDG